MYIVYVLDVYALCGFIPPGTIVYVGSKKPIGQGRMHTMVQYPNWRGDRVHFAGNVIRIANSK